jgi:asparagine synthase (glutamine-hydrolysing)
MTNTIKHRGPDDSGVQVLPHVGFGHTRLSIIDLTSAGHQPMQSEDGRYTLVYNGEVYNFQELRRELEAEGVAFQGRSDTEVVLRAFIRWKTDVFRRLSGMFALAVWDKDTQSLHLARDRFGIKPLYYWISDRCLVFGSEIKAVLASRRVTCDINWHAFHEYLYFGNALGANTMFQGIQRLLPGHYLVLDKSKVAANAYWAVTDITAVADEEQEAVGKVQTHLEHAVQSHLVSDVPVGVFLSGGIDSSAITAYASRHYSGKISTFSVGYGNDPGVNELPKAREVAQQFGTDHHELRIEGKNVQDVIEKLVGCHDEPFGDAADIPLYMLCEELKGSIKVILQGDGGDEIFAGYRRYNVFAFERLWLSLSRFIRPFNALLLQNGKFDRMMRFFQAMQEKDSALRMARILSPEMANRRPTRVFSSDFQHRMTETDPFARYRELNSRLNRLDPAQRMLYLDTMILLPDTYLEKVDKSTMAHNIEVRVPFLDTHLTEYLLSLKSNLKVRRGQKKWILRKALRGLIPDSILDGKKTGFGVPVAYWMREPLAAYLRSVLFDPVIRDAGIFDQKVLELCIREHVGGIRNHGSLLYKSLLFGLWYNRYMIRGEFT